MYQFAIHRDQARSSMMENSGYPQQLAEGLLERVDSFFDLVHRFAGSRGRPVLRKRKFAKGTESRSEPLLAEAGRAVVVAVQTTDSVCRIAEERRHYCEEL